MVFIFLPPLTQLDSRVLKQCSPKFRLKLKGNKTYILKRNKEIGTFTYAIISEQHSYRAVKTADLYNRF